MPSPEDERGRSGSGDLFEDLDDFFAPIEETDWPEPDPGGPPVAPRAAPRPPAPPEGGDEEDLLPEGWGEAIDLGDIPAPAGSATSFSLDEEEEGPALGDLLAASREEPAEAAPAERAEEAAEEAAFPERPAWERGTEGEEGAGEEAPVFIDDQAQPTAAGEPSVWEALEPSTGVGAEEDVYLIEAEEEGVAAAAGEPGGGTRELSVEDLRATPPQYAELPGPPEEDAGAEAEEGPPARTPAEPTFAGPAFEEPGFTYEEEQEPLMPAAAARPAAPGEESGDVEAAAEHFAEGMRRSPDEVERELLADMEPGAAGPPRTVRVGEPPAEAGPSWEEPASQPVAAERPRAPVVGRNLPAALITGVGLAALALVLLAIGPAPFAILAGGVVLLAQGELYAVVRRRGYQPATALALVCGGLMVFAGYNKGESAMAFILFLSLALTVAWYMAAPVKARRGTVPNIAMTMLGLIYVPFAAAFIFRILPLPTGRAIALSILGLTVLYDVAAFGVGSLWGRRPLAPTISPNKSWEGLIGSSLVTIVVAVAIVASIDPFEIGSALGLAAVVLVAAPLGDLAESVLKRDLGVKDMGTIMPGHGGLLDRIDSLLFVIPAAYYFLRIVL
ncbi:MAG TPA: phosphatidate cytidylyltransferase [Actinomycetota bacterium]|nr:phosphatidate cytidylyltransferase [Actinomycetota bacterium]